MLRKAAASEAGWPGPGTVVQGEAQASCFQLSEGPDPAASSPSPPAPFLLLGGRTAPPPVFPSFSEPGSLSLKGLLTWNFLLVHLPCPWLHRNSGRPRASPGCSLPPRPLHTPHTLFLLRSLSGEPLCLPRGAELCSYGCRRAGLAPRGRPAGPARAGVGRGLAGREQGPEKVWTSVWETREGRESFLCLGCGVS